MANLPSGAVTFLFTDIEGSTQLVKRLRDRYGEVLAEHQRLLRDAFAAHGGHEIDTQGDSFFVAFASARDAVLAAIDGQLSLLSHPWPEGVEVKVRMGIHTGQAAVADGRYTGLAVHRAARIHAAAHGGQILVSQATQTLLEDEEEDLHIFLRDLGEQRLKDLDRPVRLYQLAANGLPTGFPPLRQEAALAETAEAAIHVPLWRRPFVLAAVAVALATPVVAAVVLAVRGSGGGLEGISANHVGVIDPKTNEIVEEVPVGIRPGSVAVGAGSVWVGNLDDRTLTRLDPRRRAASATIPLDSQTPTGVAVGNGAVWTAHGRLGALSRVDPDFSRLAQTMTDLAGRSDAGTVTVGGGSVWAAYGDSTVVRIDPARSSVRGRSFAGATPTGVAFGARSLWVANGGSASVYRFNPSTFAIGRVDEVRVGRRPSAIAFGAGAVWVTSAADDRVYRIDPASGGVITIGVGDRPSAIAVGGGGVWVTNEGDKTVSRVDPVTNEVTATIEVGSVPAGVATGDGFVWVTAQAP